MKIHFAGEPDRFARVKALFPSEDTRRIVATKAEPSKFRHSLLRARAERILARMRRRVA